MNDDLICRQDAINELQKEWNGAMVAGITWDEILSDSEDAINRVPSAQPERKIGEWIKVDPHIVVCPFCKHASSPKNFCADCGADLRGWK